ncbi:MAG: M24 family metallopeptidase, partial [Actinobacteria bacterium]|nr:M24 family metallopeptidase [Actinomycetota bacterium]
DLHAEYRQWRRWKSAEELSFLQVACRSTDRAVEAVRQTIEAGRPEYELRNVVRGAYQDLGVEPVIDFVLSTPMTEPTRCVPAQFASDRRLRRGDIVVMEISASCFGYVGQALKTFTVDAEPTPLYSELHDTALRVYDTLRAAMRPSTTIEHVLGLADELIDRSEFTIWDDLVHGYGGGGYLPPVIRTPATGGADVPGDLQLIEGETVVLQPNIVTTDGLAGVQIGGLMRIGGDGTQELQGHGTDIATCGTARRERPKGL